MSGAITILEPTAREAPPVFFVDDENVNDRSGAGAYKPAAKKSWSFIGLRLVQGIPYLKNPRYVLERLGDPPNSRFR
jgi:hypothetical protein